MNKLKEMRMQLKEDDIKEILAQFGVFVDTDTENALIFPTACHNASGGSPKLYYYKEDKIFKCYTECNQVFDIFDLITRIKRTQGDEVTLGQAIRLSGVDGSEITYDREIMDDLEYLQQLSKANQSILEEEAKIKYLNKDLLETFTYSDIGNNPWIEEGITKEAMDRFSIGYYAPLNAITIPNFDHEGKLIGVRGRFLNKETKAKYMPIKFREEILSHPTGKFLYGFYENKNTIKKKGLVILFEGEKSVLKMESLYPGNNIALSTSGKRVTLDHLNALLKLNVREVVLAYDKDYRNEEERREILSEYEKIVSILSPYFDVSIIVDYGNKLSFKDSPIDKGKEVFQDLMKIRVKR